MLITFYMGGVYRNTPLMVLSFAEAAFFVLMLITALAAVSGTEQHFKKDMSYAYKGSKFTVPAIVINRRHFPINKAVVAYRYFYINKKENKAKKAVLSVEQRSEKTVDLSAVGNYCGILKVNIFRNRAGDFFNIFRLWRKADEAIYTSTIFPIKPMARQEIPVR